VASADGLRFVVPVKTLHSGLNRKYFPGQRGVTYYNFISNQFSGFHGIVIPGTLGESPYLLDGLLEHNTELQPEQIITDTAGYSDLISGCSGCWGSSSVRGWRTSVMRGIGASTRMPVMACSTESRGIACNRS
jgi:TnpA family transposase